jgi:hypothetical protein
MFENKKCKNCGEKIKGEWDFCPYCGEQISPFENVFDDIDDEFKRIDKLFAPDFFSFPKFDFKMPKGGSGINIIISSGASMKPKIKVSTSGGFKNLEPEIKKNLGIKPEIKGHVRKVSKIAEPETEIKTTGRNQIIQIKLPDVKNFNDIEVKKLEQSLEIKAFANDNTYFKLIPIPSNSEIINKEFKNNVLRIEVSKVI